MKPNESTKAVSKKQEKKNFFKTLVGEISNHKMITLIGFVLVLVISIVIWTVASASNVIVAGGSTSVAQVMANITEQYKRDKKEDILYNSLGSAAALVGVKNGSYAFGFLSKDVNSTPTQGDNRANAQQLWEDYQTSRFVFARDYIVLFYHLPAGCQINPTQDSLHFESFYGGKGTELIRRIYTDPNFTWQQAFGSQLTCRGGSNKFYTLTREAGSGTRDFFESAVIKTKNYDTNQVAASNGAMYQAVSTTPGSIGFISFSYLKTIIDDSRLGIQSIASVIGQSTTTPELPYKIIDKNLEFNPKYSLTRPFTGIINYRGSQFDKALAFIAWMLDPLPYAKTKQYLRNGKINPYYDSNFKLSVHDAAYWYIEEGEEPLTFDDIFFRKYNNNTEFAKSGKATPNEKVPWNFSANYSSIWDTILQKFPGKYQAYPGYEYNGLEN
ncbi:phosphate ABC transporter substrate-binding protein [Spiroplasma poulsonii]|uniref:Phosphate ABC transporter substrate-binding protein n=1 Tax=Spiroplasma poulsonii TaxID=2138 RepID=A0A433ESG6_9MOLU|nr:phosphate ABC transporter substrate-binding protein [Spiroplasma poulsonii]MBW3058226.1 phosphate ABC transporter substrate-binding protein [Spiroplasma poulsonii]RUP77657.1 phosphate ABC transporter substrate-binding protein [Spiroplasma poulsonii]